MSGLVATVGLIGHAPNPVEPTFEAPNPVQSLTFEPLALAGAPELPQFETMLAAAQVPALSASVESSRLIQFLG